MNNNNQNVRERNNKNEHDVEKGVQESLEEGK